MLHTDLTAVRQWYRFDHFRVAACTVVRQLIQIKFGGLLLLKERQSLIFLEADSNGLLKPMKAEYISITSAVDRITVL
jgi:hypothetical protein